MKEICLESTAPPPFLSLSMVPLLSLTLLKCWYPSGPPESSALQEAFLCPSTQTFPSSNCFIKQKKGVSPYTLGTLGIEFKVVYPSQRILHSMSVFQYVECVFPAEKYIHTLNLIILEFILGGIFLKVHISADYIYIL